jgi:hypothetical protein
MCACGRGRGRGTVHLGGAKGHGSMVYMEAGGGIV